MSKLVLKYLPETKKRQAQLIEKLDSNPLPESTETQAVTRRKLVESLPPNATHHLKQSSILVRKSTNGRKDDFQIMQKYY